MDTQSENTMNTIIGSLTGELGIVDYGEGKHHRGAGGLHTSSSSIRVIGRPPSLPEKPDIPPSLRLAAANTSTATGMSAPSSSFYNLPAQFLMNPDRAALLHEGLQEQKKCKVLASALKPLPLTGPARSRNVNFVPLGKRGEGRWDDCLLTGLSNDSSKAKEALMTPTPASSPSALPISKPRDSNSTTKETNVLALLPPSHSNSQKNQKLSKKQQKRLRREALSIQKSSLAKANPQPPKKTHPHPEPHPGGPLELPTRGSIKIPPPGYTYLPVGNLVITKKAKSQCIAENRHFYSVYHRSSTHRSGYFYPNDILEKAREYEVSTRDTREAAMKKRDAKEKDTAMSELLSQVPRISESEAGKIIERGWEKYSNRVGRTGTISLTEKVKLATLAHIRHHHTGYMKELAKAREKIAPGKKRMGDKTKTEMRIKLEARRAVQREVEKVWENWGGEPMKGNNSKMVSKVEKKTASSNISSKATTQNSDGKALVGVYAVPTSRGMEKAREARICEERRKEKEAKTKLKKEEREIDLLFESGSERDPYEESYKDDNDDSGMDIDDEARETRPTRMAALVARKRNRYDLQRLEGWVTKLGDHEESDEEGNVHMDVWEQDGTKEGVEEDIDVIDLITDSEEEDDGADYGVEDDANVEMEDLEVKQELNWNKNLWPMEGEEDADHDDQRFGRKRNKDINENKTPILETKMGVEVLDLGSTDGHHYSPSITKSMALSPVSKRRKFSLDQPFTQAKQEHGIEEWGIGVGNREIVRSNNLDVCRHSIVTSVMLGNAPTQPSVNIASAENSNSPAAADAMEGVLSSQDRENLFNALMMAPADLGIGLTQEVEMEDYEYDVFETGMCGAIKEEVQTE